MCIRDRDVARQMAELSGQLGEALDVCLEENGPLAYEPMLISDRSKIEAIGRAAAMKQAGNQGGSLLDLILQSGFFSNSDKYSLCLLYTSIPLIYKNEV